MMLRRFGLAAVLLFPAIPSGCTSPDGGAASPAPTVTVTATRTVTQTVTATVIVTPTPQAPDDLAACAIAIGNLIDSGVIPLLPDALLAIDESTSMEEAQTILLLEESLTRAADLASAKLRSALVKLDVPLRQFADVIRSGETSISMDTSTVMEDSTAVMGLCLEAGYHT